MSGFLKLEKINLKTSKNFKEKNIQDFLVENPDSLSLSDSKLIYLDREIIEYDGSILDILLGNRKNTERFCVEVQLGELNHDHIFRLLNYYHWEKSKNKNIRHAAVLVAEKADITALLPVLNQIKKETQLIIFETEVFWAAETSKYAIAFNKVYDSGLKVRVPVVENSDLIDRQYWATNASCPAVLDMLDEIIAEFKQNILFSEMSLNYKKRSVSVFFNGSSTDKISFLPGKNGVAFRAHLPEEYDDLIRSYTNAFSYAPAPKRYSISLNSENYKTLLPLMWELSSLALKLK